MLLKIAYLLTCRVLGVAVLVFRGDRAKAAELLCSGTRTRCSAATSAGSGTTRPTGCGSPHWAASSTQALDPDLPVTPATLLA